MHTSVSKQSSQTPKEELEVSTRAGLNRRAFLAGSIAFAVSACTFRDNSRIEVDPCTGAMVDKTYRWINCAGEQIEFTVPSSLYRKHKYSDMGMRYFTHAFNPRPFITEKEPKIIEIASMLTHGAKSLKQGIDNIIAFVRMCIPYDSVEAHPLNDYGRKPGETLFTGDDCDGSSYLQGSLIKAFIDNCDSRLKADHRENILAVFVYLDHISLGLSGNFRGDYYRAQGRKFYYAESRADPMDPGLGYAGPLKGINPLWVHLIR